MSFNKTVSRTEIDPNPFVRGIERPGQLISEQFEEAVVVDVIVNNHHDEYAVDGYNVGAIKFRFINTNYFRPDDSLNWAFAMDANKSEYPLTNEIVYVFQSLNRFYYFRKFNVSNRPTSQGMFGINEEAQPIASPSENIKHIKSSTVSPHKPPPLDGSGLGEYFTEKPNVHRLKHIEGDIIYEGRSGHSIRFGTSWLDGISSATARDKRKPWQSSTIDQAPNLLIRIGPDPKAVQTVDSIFGQVIEDINRDKGSIWMVSDQIVPLKYSTEQSGIHRTSVVDFPNKLDGNQIIINTDRFVINTKVGKIMGHSTAGIHWTTLQDFTVDADRDHITWTNRNRSDRVVNDCRTTVGGNKTNSVVKNITSIAGDSQTLSATNKISTVSKKIHIGSISDVSEPLVLGDTLRDFLDQLISVLTQEPIVLVTGRPGGPSTQNPRRIAKLNQLKSQFLSNGTSAKILSLDNFTIRKNQSSLQVTPIKPYREG